MRTQTTWQQRQEFFVRHRNGETYQQIAERAGVSRECVRYWCRRQRDGGDCHTHYARPAQGPLYRFDAKVRYCILRLRLQHPRWGPNRIRAHLKKRRSLWGLTLPSDASIGRYLHQWKCFRRQPKQVQKRERPQPATRVHQRWQLDFKLGIALRDGTQLNLHTVCDPLGKACIGAFLTPAGSVKHLPKRVTFDQIQAMLRACFARWGTLPEELQTDGETVFIGQPQDAFPTPFTLWLTGLGIHHMVIRPGKPTDNAEVERWHHTLNGYAIVGNEKADTDQLQEILSQSLYELNYELASRAAGCEGRPPIVAHPELTHPRRPFDPTHELAQFDLARVDAYLATFTWPRRVGKTGQISLGGQHQRYSVGRAYAGQSVDVRFDPADRHFVFFARDEAQTELGRRPARDLEVADLTGIATWPEGLVPQQLPLPLCLPKGVNC